MSNTKPAPKKWEIAFTPKAWDQWWLYCNLMPGEVGCFGYVTLDTPSMTAYVDDLFLVPQEASAAEVDFIKDGLPYAVEKAVADDRLEDLRFCIHSHGEIGTMWSGTDEEMIATMGANADWFVSCVTNRKGSMRGRIDVFRFEPLGECHIKFDELRMYRHVTVDVEDEAKAQLDKFVSKPAPTTTWAHGTQGVAMGKPKQHHGKPYKNGGQWRYWTGDQMVTLKEEGDDIFSYDDKLGVVYVDDEGQPVGWGRSTEPAKHNVMLEWNGDLSNVHPLTTQGWAMIGEDVVVVSPEGVPVLDMFDCCITDEDLVNYEIDQLLLKDALDKWGVYLSHLQEQARRSEVVT